MSASSPQASPPRVAATRGRGGGAGIDRHDLTPGLRVLFALDRGLRRLFPPRVRRVVPWLMLLPAFGLILILGIGLMELFAQSLHILDKDTFRLSPAYSIANYVSVFTEAAYRAVVWRTLAGAVIVTLVCLVLGFPYAYAIVRTSSRWLRKTLLVALLLPFFVGQVVRAYSWLVVLGKQGLLNATLGWFGVGHLELLHTYTAVLIGLVQYMLPFAVLMMIPAVTAVPREMEWASEGLGARRWQTLRHLVIPLCKPGFTAAGVVVFTLTLTDFAMPEIMGGGRLDFIANSVYDAFFQLSNAGLGAALSIVLALIGSALVAIVFTIVGVGTLGYVQTGAS